MTTLRFLPGRSWFARGVTTLLLAASGARGQEPAPPPPPPQATSPTSAPQTPRPGEPGAGEGPVTATVIQVSGRPQWRSASAPEWKDLQVDDVLETGTRIRTDLRSVVTLILGQNATIRVRPLTNVELSVLVRKGVQETRTSLSFGQLDVRVKDTDLTNDFVAVTPSATLSVRGTGFSLLWGAFRGTEVVGFDGNKLRAIEMNYFRSRKRVSLSGAATSEEDEPDPVEVVLLSREIEELYESRELKRVERGEPMVPPAPPPRGPHSKPPKQPFHAPATVGGK